MMNQATTSVKMQPTMTSSSFFDDGGLQVELHPGGDGGADDADDHVEVGVLLKGGELRRLDGGGQGLDPRGFGEEAGENVRDIEKGGRKENFFDALVLALDDDEPDDDGADGNGIVLGNAEQFHAAGDARELGDDVAEIRDQNAEHHEEGDAQAELFADEVAKAFAGDGAHAGAHFLDHNQRDGDWDHRPEQHVAELRAGSRVRKDATGIVVDVRGNKSGSYHGEEEQDLDFPAFQEFHARSLVTCGWSNIASRTP